MSATDTNVPSNVSTIPSIRSFSWLCALVCSSLQLCASSPLYYFPGSFWQLPFLFFPRPLSQAACCTAKFFPLTVRSKSTALISSSPTQPQTSRSGNWPFPTKGNSFHHEGVFLKQNKTKTKTKQNKKRAFSPETNYARSLEGRINSSTQFFLPGVIASLFLFPRYTVFPPKQTTGLFHRYIIFTALVKIL